MSQLLHCQNILLYLHIIRIIGSVYNTYRLWLPWVRERECCPLIFGTGRDQCLGTATSFILQHCGFICVLGLQRWLVTNIRIFRGLKANIKIVLWASKNYMHMFSACLAISECIFDVFYVKFGSEVFTRVRLLQQQRKKIVFFKV